MLFSLLHLKGGIKMTNYKMTSYALTEAMPGMQLGKDILNDGGQVMVVAGTMLTTNIIEGLKCWDIPSVVIRSEVIDTPVVVEIPPVVDEPISESQQKFYNTYDSTTSTVKKTFGKMRYFKEVPLQKMQEIAENEIFPMIEAIGVINHLQMVRHQDDYTFQHSINVAVICGVLGKWLGYKGAELSDLVLAGLLHDIGKTQIPLEILDKPDTLSTEEMKVMQTHALSGYKLIKDNKELSAGVTYAVLQHHERMDGKGYPFQMAIDNIHQYARIVAVADTYDAMTSDRVYHKKMTPFSVVETMASEMYDKLDPTICAVFLNNVRSYFIGNSVKLSDGRRAEVVYLGPFMGTRPTVITQDGKVIDLEKNKSIGIIELMNA